jgi:hypothetical protein
MGNRDTEIPDDIIVAALNLIKSMCDNPLQQYIGYFTPAEILFSLNSTTTAVSTVVKQAVPDGQFSVNIHPLPGHWVTSCYDPQKNRVSVYDSLISQTHYRQVVPQLKMVYGVKNASNIQYCQVTQQGSEQLCGVMAICFAFSLFLGKDPECIEYDCGKVRDHLRQCLLHGQMSEFPEITNNLEHNSGGRNFTVNTTAVTDNLQKYFEDQHTRNVQHRLQNLETNSQKEDRTNCYKKHLDISSVDKQSNKRKNDRLRKTLRRQSMTETEKMHMKFKDRVRKRLIRSQKSPTEKENDLETDKLRKEKERCQMTCSDKESILHKDKVRKKQSKKPNDLF